MLIIRKKNIVINEKISERRIKMNTETLNNFETTQMVKPTMEVTSVDTPVDMPNNIEPALKDQFSTGEKIGLAGGVIVGLAGVAYGVYFLVKKAKAKRAAKKAAKEVKVEEDSK